MFDWLSKLDELRQTGTPAALVTVVRCAGSAPAEPGVKLIALADGSAFGTIGGGRFEQLAIEDARGCIESGESKMFRYPLGAAAGQCCGGLIETFVDVLHVGPQLYLFGAGHVGQALCRVLSGTPFLVHAIDEREQWLSALPAEVRRHAMAWDEFVRDAVWSKARTYVVLMTHRHDLDEAILGDIVGRPTRYVGLIGSETKWRRFRDRLSSRAIPVEALDRVKCPIGLDLGGKSPPEIAVSIAAELLSVHHGHTTR
jgi:xanthine dehydrogenase accessory factor